MPVRFRCKHCHQLLGIARRKIGTEVRCPECKKMVLVPADDAPDWEEPTRKGDAPAKLDDAPAAPQPLAADPAPKAVEEVGAPVLLPAAKEAFDAELYKVPQFAPAGVLLSPWHTLLLTVMAVIILALAFAVGLLVGRFVL